MVKSSKKTSQCYSPFAMMREKNRLEALSSFGLSTKNIKSIDKTMHKIATNCKKAKNNENCTV